MTVKPSHSPEAASEKLAQSEGSGGEAVVVVGSDTAASAGWERAMQARWCDTECWVAHLVGLVEMLERRGSKSVGMAKCESLEFLELDMGWVPISAAIVLRKFF